MSTKGDDRFAPKSLSTDQAGKGQIFVLGILGVRFVACCAGGLFGEEGAGGGVGGEEGIVELPAV